MKTPETEIPTSVFGTANSWDLTATFDRYRKYKALRPPYWKVSSLYLRGRLVSAGLDIKFDDPENLDIAVRFSPRICLVPVWRQFDYTSGVRHHQLLLSLDLRCCNTAMLISAIRSRDNDVVQYLIPWCSMFPK